MRFRDLSAVLKQVAKAWSEDRVPSMGAALAFYTTFSLAPLLLIVMAVAGLVFGEEAARGQIQSQLRSLMGEQGAGAVQALLASVHQPVESAAAAAVGGITLLIGATTVFGELQDALDRIWRANNLLPSHGWWLLLRNRLLSFGMILAIGFLLMVSLMVSAALASFGQGIGSWLGEWVFIAQAVNTVLSFVSISVMFALIYKYMPRVHVHWKDVWIGAVITAVLFTVGKALIGLYLGRSSVSSGFGAAGSLVVVLLWVYYSAQIFLLGAEITWVYANSFGSRKAEGLGR
jgi:membrane protein